MLFATVRTGMTLCYEVRGEGEPVLLVMGLGAQLVSWPDAFVDGLVERGFQVIAFDNRDIGLSTKGTSKPPGVARSLAGALSRRFARSEYLMTDMADDAAGLLDSLGIARAHIVGVSMGGMIAQQLAIDHPDRVLSITSIMSTTGDRRVGRAKTSILPKLLKLTKGGPETYVDRQAEVFRLISGSSHDEADVRTIASRSVARDYTPDGTARQAAAVLASPDRTPLLRTLNVPALVVHGFEDTLVAPSGGFATTKAIPGARLLAFADMGHNLPKNRIPEILDAIAENNGRAAVLSPIPLG